MTSEQFEKMREECWAALDYMFDYDYPDYILRARKTYLLLNMGDVFGEAHKLKVTVKDLVFYYYRDARNITSGCRSLAGHVGDWRGIDELANICLQYFKIVNRSALVKEGKKYGMTLKG